MSMITEKIIYHEMENQKALEHENSDGKIIKTLRE